RRRYTVIAVPLHCNRVAVTVQSRRDNAVTAKIFGRKLADGVAKRRKATLFPLYLHLFPSVKFRQ
uniref:hypothetical protein n=1 Tax=Prevotella sp. TaxID=59823 RepID=UPI00402A3993